MCIRDRTADGAVERLRHLVARVHVVQRRPVGVRYRLTEDDRHSLEQASSLNLLQLMLHVDHPLLQFADITDLLQSSVALFYRFYSHKIQTSTIKTASYLPR